MYGRQYSKFFQEAKTVTGCLKVRDELMSSGRVAEIKKEIVGAGLEQKKNLGKELNELKKEIQEACDLAIQSIQKEQEKEEYIDFDPTFYSPKYKQKSGSLHPVTLVVQEIVEILTRLGFDVYDSTLVTKQWDNFTSANMPDYHPAREMQDTFFLDQKDQAGEQYVMRTQVTANVSRYAKEVKAPFRVIFPGIVFRNEDIDLTHDINFTQFDMWLVDRQASIAQLLTLVRQFYSEFFNDPNMEVRTRPSYFPFTQPSMEGDITCPFCRGEGCRVCKQTGWIEVFGAGPIHRQVITNIGLNPDKWQGIAWGFGVDRLVQIKYKISQLSQFYNGHLDFLEGRELIDNHERN
jgi:phenylalanyl-tRNA synthetase alpha chain